VSIRAPKINLSVKEPNNRIHSYCCESLTESSRDSEFQPRSEYLTANYSIQVSTAVRPTDANQNCVIMCQCTLHNPKRAEHRGGFWDLGEPSSTRIESVTLSIQMALGAERSLRWAVSIHDKKPIWKESRSQHWSILQLNSGGENWQSQNHVDADRMGLAGARGYQLIDGDQRYDGLRATPTVELVSDQGNLAVTMADFWQKFPSAIEVSGNEVLVHLFPEQPGRALELQPGERFTRTIWLQQSPAGSPPAEMAVTTQAPPRPDLLDIPHRRTIATNHWLSVGPLATDEESLMEELLTGKHNFFWKREQIDEYGWRNFGDFWADHEQQYADVPIPVISHYNNQYDLLHGLLGQYLRTNDSRWWQLGRPLAEHIIDVDIYHTAQDRSVYNGGLFWHTAHYRDAGTCSHRSYSRTMTGEKNAVHGGGPSNEHNYTTGLLLYYRLTGCERAKTAALSLANWVIAMDDGRRSILAPLSSCPTGVASATYDPEYHGPGRGVGNSINALVDAWQLTRSEHYLDKARELIHRVIHPNDDIDALDLLNAEARWSYTVALQSLLRYDMIVAQHDSVTSTYAAACLIAYGRWMLANEQLYLSHPDQLEFPTETWAAQDMRKGTTLMLIANYLPEPERSAMYHGGKKHYESAKQQLLKFPSRVWTRPAAIALQQFPIAQYANSLHSLPARTTQEHIDLVGHAWPPKHPFQTQRSEIKQKLRSPIGILQLTKNACRPWPWRYTIPETFIGRTFRRWNLIRQK